MFSAAPVSDPCSPGSKPMFPEIKYEGACRSATHVFRTMAGAVCEQRRFLGARGQPLGQTAMQPVMLKLNSSEWALNQDTLECSQGKKPPWDCDYLAKQLGQLLLQGSIL